MYVRYLYIVFFILTINVSQSQSLTVKFGEKINYNPEYSAVGFFEQSGEKLLFQKKNNKRRRTGKYDYFFVDNYNTMKAC